MKMMRLLPSTFDTTAFALIFFFINLPNLLFLADFIGSSPLISSLTWERAHVPYLNSLFNNGEPQGP